MRNKRASSEPRDGKLIGLLARVAWHARAGFLIWALLFAAGCNRDGVKWHYLKSPRDGVHVKVLVFKSGAGTLEMHRQQVQYLKGHIERLAAALPREKTEDMRATNIQLREFYEQQLAFVSGNKVWPARVFRSLLGPARSLSTSWAVLRYAPKDVDIAVVITAKEKQDHQEYVQNEVTIPILEECMRQIESMSENAWQKVKVRAVDLFADTEMTDEGVKSFEQETRGNLFNTLIGIRPLKIP